MHGSLLIILAVLCLVSVEGQYMDYMGRQGRGGTGSSNVGMVSRNGGMNDIGYGQQQGMGVGGTSMIFFFSSSSRR